MSTSVYIYGPAFSTFVRSVMLVCEEKGIAYRQGLKAENTQQDDQNKTDDEKRLSSVRHPGHQQLNPFLKVPVLIHQDKTLFETAPICRYLDNTFSGPSIQSGTPWHSAIIDQWSSAICSYIDQVLVRKYLLEFAFPKGENGEIRGEKITQIQPQVTATLAILTKQLADQPFFCGQHYSMADALLTPILDYIYKLPAAYSLPRTNTLLCDYIQRMQDRPSGVKVLNAT